MANRAWRAILELFPDHTHCRQVGETVGQKETSTSLNSVSSVLPPSDKDDAEVSGVLKPAGWMVGAADGGAYPDAVSNVGWLDDDVEAEGTVPG